ncbi:MAG: IPTL-CTERM sorting domain-containing protein [Pseudomonadota bacterium]
MSRLMAFLACCCITGKALATTYQLPSDNWRITEGSYTTAMRYSGTFTTEEPLPPNLASFPIGPAGNNLATRWRISDGLFTYTEANSREYGGDQAGFTVSTDALGNVTGLDLSLGSPTTGVMVDDPINAFEFDFLDGEYTAGAVFQYPCSEVVDGTCDDIEELEGQNLAGTNPQEVGQIITLTPPSAIPTLSRAGLALLAAMLLAGVVFYRRTLLKPRSRSFTHRT